MFSKILDFITGKRLVSGVLVLLVLLVLAYGAFLFQVARGDLQELKAVYELVVINTLAEPFIAILAAYVAYVFGDLTARVMNNRNAMRNGRDPADFPLE